MKNLLFFLTFIFLSVSTTAQTFSNLFKQQKKGYEISGEITGLKDTSVMLAYYFGGKQYATDTAAVTNGKFSFKGKKELKGGMYLVVLSNEQYFDLIISEQIISNNIYIDYINNIYEFDSKLNI